VKWLIAIAIASLSRAAAGEPLLDHVVTAPTAWLPRDGVAFGDAALDHRGDGSIAIGYGLGGIASVTLGADTDVRTCSAPPCTTDHRAQPVAMGRAAFRIGARRDAWFAGQPALLLGVAVTLGQGGPRATEAYLIASRALGGLRLHAGVEAIDGAAPDDGRMGAELRPLGGFEWTPPQYPKTTLLADVAWLPRLEPPNPVPEWVLGWAVRYQALTWGSIELAVRHREGEGLAASTVMVRINGIWER
jgi:hypothetical protein